MEFAKRLFYPVCLGLLFLSLFASALVHAQNQTDISADAAAASPFPTGVDTYKIVVDDEGIYEITKSELVAAGFPSGASLSSYKLTNRGETVSYQLVDSGQTIRFYAGPFAGNWEEKQHVDEEIFFLWPGSGTTVAQVGSSTGTNVVTDHRAFLKYEVDDFYSSTKINSSKWEEAGLDPDSMYWKELIQTGNTTVTTSLPMTLPGKIAGDDAIIRYMVAIEGKGTSVASDGNLKIKVNDYTTTVDQYVAAAYGSYGTPYILTHTVPAAELDINNTIAFTHSAATKNSLAILLINYIEVSYDSALSADQDQLIFSQPGSSSFDFRLTDFSTTDPNQIIFWDITNKNTPVSIAPRTYSSGSHRIGVSQSGDARYIAVADAAVKTVRSITEYNGPSLTPAGGSADWIAITHADFKTAAQSLAIHRASFSGLSTQVVDVNDIFNQFGYGYPTPQAIKAFLQNAYDNWPTAPSYVVLFGDGNLNPRQISCQWCQACPLSSSFCSEANADWVNPYTSFMPFNYAFEDRFLGLVPSDHAYTLLDGDDLHSDIAIGRFSVETAAEATNAVNKVIQYENGLKTPQAWHDDIYFIHDYNKNTGDNFVGDINQTISHIPVGMDTPVDGMNSPGDSSAVIVDINNTLNSGVALFNYRGHGSMTNWSGGFLSADMVKSGAVFNNVDKPVVTLSMDCLDGHFGYPNIDSLSETLIRQNNRGAAAHWSSTGLGFSFEHNILAKYFYQALLSEGDSAIGDAINHSKVNYLNDGYDQSEAYTFLLQGDPAMQLFLPQLSFSYNTNPPKLKGGESGIVSLIVTNNSPFSGSNHATITYTLPTSVNLNSVTGNGVSATTAVNGSGQTVVTISLTNGIPANGQLLINFDVTPDINTPTTTVSTPAQLFLPGISQSQTVTLRLRDKDERDFYLPLIVR